MPDEILEEDADLQNERAEEHGTFLGVSEISYSHLLDAAVRHAIRPPVAADPTWVSIGPRNVGGRITAVGQNSDNPLVVYAGSAHGGLWVSSDAGDTWEHVGRPEHNFPVGTIAVPPGDASTVIIGTGSMAARYVAGQGIFRVSVPADPANAVFARLAGPPPIGSSPGDPTLAGQALRYTRIRIDPENPARFWVASQTGLWRYEPAAGAPGFVRDFPTRDGEPSGAPSFATALSALATWPSYCTDLLVARDPRASDRFTENRVEGARYLVLYVGIESDGVYRGRFDRKERTIRWDDKLDVPNANLYTGGRAFTRVRLALCEHRPSVVYAVFSSDPGPDPANPPNNLPEQDHASYVFRSDNNGDRWVAQSRIPRASGYTDGATTRDGQADYDLLLEVSPGNPDALVCGEIDVCLSTDGARNWTTILDWRNYDLGDYSQHADQHIALFDRGDHRRLWVGNDGGLSLARDLRRPAGEPKFWRKRSHGILAGQFQDVTAHPNPALRFMCGGGLQDNGSYASFGGPTWLHVGRADGGALAFHVTTPEYVFVAQQKTVRLAAIEATPVPTFAAGLSNPVLADLPLPDQRASVRLERLTTAGGAGSGPFIGVLVQNPLLPGNVLVGWKASPTKAIAYLFAPPPAPPLATPLPPAPAVGSLSTGVALGGLTAGGGAPIVANAEFASAVEFGPSIVAPPAAPAPSRVEGWIGTSAGQLLFALNGASPVGWNRAPTALPVPGGIPQLVTRVAVHPSDSWIVAVSTVPDVRNLPATASAALVQPITIRITVGGIVGPSRFTFAIGTAPAGAAAPTAPSVTLPGTMTTVYFTPGAFVVGDSWTIAPDGSVTRAPGNTSAGGVAASVTAGGRVYLTWDRGTSWVDVSAPTAPLPRPTPDSLALPPGSVAALEWDRSVPAATSLFAGTLAGVYVLGNLPSPTGLALAVKPATIPLGTALRLQAMLALTAGPPIDCTSAADWSTSNPAVVTIPAPGRVLTAAAAVVGNSATISVRRGTLVDTVTLQITPAAVVPAPGPAAPFAAPNMPVTWRPFGKTLPLTLVNDLTMVPGTRRLRAATFGRGMWDVDLAGDTAHQLYIRQTVIEDGRTYPRGVPNVGPAPGLPLMDPRRPQAGATRFAIDFTHAYDIRVDAPPHDFFDDVVDGVEFDEQGPVNDPIPFEDNYVYVQVNQAGVSEADVVHVFLFAAISPFAAQHGTAPVAVPAIGTVQDFYPPADAAKPVAPWVRVGQSPSVLRKVGPAKPVVARFTWVPDDSFVGRDVALLAMCTTPGAGDPLQPAPAAGAATLSDFIINERRAALRIVHVAPRPAASLYVRDGIADDTRLGGYPVAGRSPDIMVVRPDITSPPGDAFKDFIARRHTDTVSATGTNVVYVRVHNRRRFTTKAQVKLFVITLGDDSRPDTTLANWIELPAGAATFAEVDVPPLGVGYARLELQNAVDPNPGGLGKVYLLLALVQSQDATDALPSRDAATDADAFWELVSKYVDADNAAARAIPWVP